MKVSNSDVFDSKKKMMSSEKSWKKKLNLSRVFKLISSFRLANCKKKYQLWLVENSWKLETLNQMQKELAKGEVAQAKVEELLKFGMNFIDLNWPRMTSYDRELVKITMKLFCDFKINIILNHRSVQIFANL